MNLKYIVTTFLVVFSCITHTVFGQSNHQERQKEKQFLQELYDLNNLANNEYFSDTWDFNGGVSDSWYGIELWEESDEGYTHDKRQRIRRLDLDWDGVNKIPSIARGLTPITVLDKIETIVLSRNNLTNDPSLANNPSQYETLPDEFFELYSLKHLDLRMCSFIELPEGICQLENLVTLHLYYNFMHQEGLRLKAIPECMANLKYLVSLNLSANHISSIPDAFWNKEFLPEGATGFIDLEYNRLTEIPGSIPDHKWEIDFSRNQIDAIERTVMPAPNSFFNVAGNNLTFSDVLIYEDVTTFPFYNRFGGQGNVEKAETVFATVGEVLNFEVKVDLNTDPISTYTWFKMVNGEEVEITTGLSEENTKLEVTIDSEDDYTDYYYRVKNTHTAFTVYEPDAAIYRNFITVKCPEFTTGSLDYEQQYCISKFEAKKENLIPYEQCDIVLYSWDFDTQDPNNEIVTGFGEIPNGTNGYKTNGTYQSPLHEYDEPGIYTVALTVTYTCGTSLCGEKTLTVTRTVEVKEDFLSELEPMSFTFKTPVLQNVLNSSVVVFTDKNEHTELTSSLESETGFTNGTEGVYRPTTVYSYSAERQSGGQVNLKNDGVYDLAMFNWQYAHALTSAQWLKKNQINRVSASGNETESEDQFGLRSAQLYGHYNRTLIATATNASYNEIAFTSFEKGPGDFFYGNWKLTDDPTGGSFTVEIYAAHDNAVIVKAPLSQMQSIEEINVEGHYVQEGRDVPFVINNNQIVCWRSYEENPLWSIIVLEESPINDDWTGILKSNTPYIPTSAVNLSSEVAHSGKYSWEVPTSGFIKKQSLLHLEEGKEYFISGWITNNDRNINVKNQGVGLIIEFLNEEDNVLSQSFIAVVGGKIEKWQKLEGGFLFPEGASSFRINIANANNIPIWIDDLRLLPESANMNTYVYDPVYYRLAATQDENNFSTFYYYDHAGKLYLIKKETDQGVKTIQESVEYLKVKN